ncbi:hypothetical protein BKA82DRAFT_4230374 [Pisolithus tinctorius]|nr:hypothetical protein BKA82DRAFT_4230374 [Pisolithus tinctorius]
MKVAVVTTLLTALVSFDTHLGRRCDAFAFGSYRHIPPIPVAVSPSTPRLACMSGHSFTSVFLHLFCGLPWQWRSIILTMRTHLFNTIPCRAQHGHHMVLALGP